MRVNHSFLLTSILFIWRHFLSDLSCYNWATGCFLFLTVKFWILHLILNSAWQVPSREQHTIKGLHTLPSFRPQEAVPSWPKCLWTLTYPLQEELSVCISHWQGCQCAIWHNKHKRTPGAFRSQRLSKWNPFQVQWERKWVLLRKFLHGLSFTEQPKLREKGVRTSFVHYFYNLFNVSAPEKFMEQLYHSKCPLQLTLTWALFFGVGVPALLPHFGNLTLEFNNIVKNTMY